jgi:hypothetical protein
MTAEPLIILGSITPASPAPSLSQVIQKRKPDSSDGRAGNSKIPKYQYHEEFDDEAASVVVASKDSTLFRLSKHYVKKRM